LKLTEFQRPRTTWLQLSDSRNNCANCGDLMFSLSYLPTAERLTVVVVKARNLKPSNDENENHAMNENEIQNVYVKVSCNSLDLIFYIFYLSLCYIGSCLCISKCERIINKTIFKERRACRWVRRMPTLLLYFWIFSINSSSLS
jgi:hypothetical protein